MSKIALNVFMVTLLAVAGKGMAEKTECAISGAAVGSIGGPFELTRHDGVRVTDKDVITDLTMVYFGYTFCPDICPVDTAKIAEVADILEKRGIPLTPVMITIDPKRDTVEVMQDYTSWLHPQMIGLTGSDDDIAKAAKAYKVFFRQSGHGDDYLMSHTSFTYLMAPEHGLLDFYNRDASAQDMADAAACFAKSTDVPTSK